MKVIPNLYNSDSFRMISSFSNWNVLSVKLIYALSTRTFSNCRPSVRRCVSDQRHSKSSDSNVFLALTPIYLPKNFQLLFLNICQDILSWLCEVIIIRSFVVTKKTNYLAIVEFKWKRLMITVFLKNFFINQLLANNLT